MAKKITKRDRFSALLNIEAVKNDPEMVEFIEHEIELLDKKNSAERKPSKAQVEKAEKYTALRLAIVDEMEMGKPYSASDLLHDLPSLSAEADLTPAKVPALIAPLVEDGSIIRTVDKKRHVVYSLSE